MSYFNVDKRVEDLKTKLNESDDFAFRFFDKKNQKIAFVYLKSIIDNQLLSESIYQPFQSFNDDISIEKSRMK